MLALNYKTGEMAWGYQVVHHDIWDYDQSVAPIMINAEVEGKKQEDVMVGNKDGYIYDVNAETGQPVFPTPEKAVPQNVPLRRRSRRSRSRSSRRPRNMHVTPDGIQRPSK